MNRDDCDDEIVHFPVQIATGENPNEVWYVGCSDVCKPIQLACLDADYDPDKPISCRENNCMSPRRGRDGSRSRDTCNRSRSGGRCLDQNSPMVMPCNRPRCSTPCASRGPIQCSCKCRWVAWKFEERGRCPRFVFGRITKACNGNDRNMSFEKVYYAAAFSERDYLRVTDRGIPPSLLNFDCLDDDNRVFEYQRLRPYPLFLLKHVASGYYVRKCQRLLTLSRVENASTWILRR